MIKRLMDSSEAGPSRDLVTSFLSGALTAAQTGAQAIDDLATHRRIGRERSDRQSQPRRILAKGRALSVHKAR